MFHTHVSLNSLFLFLFHLLLLFPAYYAVYIWVLFDILFFEYIAFWTVDLNGRMKERGVEIWVCSIYYFNILFN